LIISRGVSFIWPVLFIIGARADAIANVVIPAGCELIGMWGGEWDIERKPPC
jgi:hypothetical protein